MCMSRLKFAAWAAAWAAVVALGFGWTYAHAATPGMTAKAPARWPAEGAPAEGASAMSKHAAVIALDPQVPTLIVFAHPHCACTRATLHELEWITTRAQGLVHAYVVFAKPPGAGVDWESTTLHAKAVAMKGVTVLDDDEDVLAHRFLARTSGHVVLYTPGGELRFSGGITGERGHEGDNAGRAAVLVALRARTSPPTFLGLVFGCELDTPEKPR